MKQMLSRLSTVFMAVVLALSSAVAQKSDQGEVQLKAAIKKETVDGDLKGAIAQYGTIVAKYKNDRAVAAMALVRMAECYRKMGDAESRKIYERVLRDYADQKEAVALARARLGRSEPAARGTGVVARSIWAGPGVDDMGSPSPDGRFLTFTDWETGDLAVRDLTAGTERRLSSKGGWEQSGDYAFKSRMSPDGKQVAFGWQKQSSIDLRLIGIDGGRPRVLYANPEAGYLEPADWSPDSKHILTALNTRSRTAQIALISVSDGSASILKTLPWGSLGRMSFSPDGHYIAYDFQPKEESTNRNIVLLSSNGSREITLSENPAQEEVFGWRPDGKALLFASNRTGTRELWSLAIADGKAEGPTELVWRDIGRISPIGLTRKGALYYAVRTGISEVYIASWDWKSGRMIDAPKPAGRRLLGVNRDPGWSPDGKYLAYISQRGGRGSEVITILSVESGEERQLSPQLSLIQSGTYWSSDGRSLLVMAFDQKKREGAYSIDVHTGEVKSLAQAQSGQTIFHPEWLPGDKAIVYYRRDDAPQPSHLVVRDLESGAERELPSGAEGSGFIGTSLSPDGHHLAFTTNAGNIRTLRVVPVAGGVPRELVRHDDAAGRIGLLGWTHDSAQVIFATSRRAGLQVTNYELWRMPAEGGERYRLPAVDTRVGQILFHPDGRRIAFHSSQGKMEVWMLENFLPNLSASK